MQPNAPAHASREKIPSARPPTHCCWSGTPLPAPPPPPVTPRTAHQLHDRLAQHLPHGLPHALIREDPPRDTATNLCGHRLELLISERQGGHVGALGGAPLLEPPPAGGQDHPRAGRDAHQQADEGVAAGSQRRLYVRVPYVQPGGQARRGRRVMMG